MGELRRSLLGHPARLRALVVLAVIAAAAGVVVATVLPGSSRGASSGNGPSGSATVQRRDLVATDTESGTLGYAGSQTVYNRLAGTITQLPSVGQVIRPGGVLYRVDGAPVVLLDGATPAYRTLSAAVTPGPDITQLKRNLIALGFDPHHQITVNDSFDSATTYSVELWQGSLGQPQTGIVNLGQVVFLPGARRITAVDATLGSTGGGGGSAASASLASQAGLRSAAPPPTYVDLRSGVTPVSATSAPNRPAPPRGGNGATSATGATGARGSTGPASKGTGGAGGPRTRAGGGGGGSASQAQQLAALTALLRAETQELRSARSASSAGGAGAGGTGSRTSGSATRSGGAGAAGGASGSTSSAAGSSASSGPVGSGSGGGSASAILQTSTDQLEVTVELDATKQSEAVVGERVQVQLPDGSVTGGRITAVSQVAQSTSSSGSGSGSGSGGGSGGGASGNGSGGGGSSSGAPSATVPVTIALSGRRPAGALDQAAVSVNFAQQVERGVLAVPVTALLATAGGGYAVQESAPPHRMIPVTPGLFAAGYVQVSGGEIHPGLAVTDAQG